MPANTSPRRPEEQLLGEIETRIAGMQYYEAIVQPREPVNLEREPENPHDPCSIRVENGRFEPVGHLPRRVARWMAPLVDAGQIRIEGYIPQDAQPIAKYRGSLPVTLTVYVSESGRSLILPRDVQNKLDALHETVRRGYEDAAGCANADLVDGRAEGLQSLARQRLLPETHLLLSLLPGIAREKRVAQGVQAMARLGQLLGALQIGAPLDLESLTVFPLLWPDPCEPTYTVLETAIETGMAVVEEMSENGDVPHLAVTNNGPLPVLILEGEILIGAKQNRVVNVTVLVAAHSRFTLPVSCVEQGRWQYQGRQFHSRYAAPPSIRSKKLRSVQRNRRQCGQAHSDQGEVWNGVAASLSELGARSQTASLTDGFLAADARLRQCREHLELPKEAAGLLVARGGTIVAMDLFGSPQVFDCVKQRLLDAYFLDGLRDQRQLRKSTPEDARRFLDRIVARACPRMPALGEGIELEIDAEEMVGGALLYGDQLCHLAAFDSVP